jgi:hypothetical protein
LICPGTILRGPKLGECCQKNGKFSQNYTELQICPTVSQEKFARLWKSTKKNTEYHRGITSLVPILFTLVWLDAIREGRTYPHNFPCLFSSYSDSLRFWHQGGWMEIFRQKLNVMNWSKSCASDEQFINILNQFQSDT